MRPTSARMPGSTTRRISRTTSGRTRRTPSVSIPQFGKRSVKRFSANRMSGRVSRDRDKSGSEAKLLRPKLILILTLIMLLPLGALGWLGWRMARQEREVVENRFREALTERLRGINGGGGRSAGLDGGWRVRNGKSWRTGSAKR